MLCVLSTRLEKVCGLSVSIRPFVLLSLSVGADLKRTDIEIDGQDIIDESNRRFS